MDKKVLLLACMMSFVLLFGTASLVLASCHYTGCYSGTYGGGESGKWEMTINDDCGITVTSLDPVTGSGSMPGSWEFEGGFAFGNDTNWGQGTIGSGSVSGNWYNHLDNTKGTFRGESTGCDGEEEDSSGGCFMNVVF